MELPSQPWSAAQCSSLGQRDLLARFWLSCPDDLLESLWNSPLGRSTCELVRQLTPETSFNSEQIGLREAIGTRLQAGFQAPCAIQLCLANWLLSPPGLMRVANPEANLPSWLLPSYLELYEKSEPVNQLEESAASKSVAPPQPAVNPPSLNFGSFPLTLQALIADRVQLNRMLGLSNLYYIDPEDQEILTELRDVRLAFCKAIQDCPEAQLEQFWSTELKDRYAAMVRSGLQHVPLNSMENQLKEAVTTQLQPSEQGGFGKPGATNAFLIAMRFYLPGTMQVDGAETKLSPWLFNIYQELFAQALNTSS